MHHVLPLSLQRRRPGRIRPRLEPFREALHGCGNPQQSWPSILVVGTNGKGSVAAITAAVLGAHGARVGLYTSPHLVRVEERIRIDGAAIDGDQFDRHLSVLDAFPQLTFFETVTAAAFLAFAEAGVDVVVLEAGMGGRWDATRAAASEVAGLTNVGSDHAAWLGSAPAAVAADKGAALAAARLAVVGSQVDAQTMSLLAAPQAVPASDLIRVAAGAPGRAEVTIGGEEVDVVLPLAGSHQVANLGLSLALHCCAADLGWAGALEREAVLRGLARVRWPGRLSQHRIGGRQVMLDCAHNLEAAVALAHHLGGLERRFNLLFSCLDDKPVEEMAAVLRPVVGRVAVCGLADERAMPVARMAAAFTDAEQGHDPAAALDLLPDPVLAAGSLRLVGALLERAEEEP
jgi:dihydrofolate synthase/folylpolyglutamate synthase